MVHRLTLAYDGAPYCGWQRQTNGRSVQQLVEEAVEGLLGSAVRIHGAGRTDAGVHARGQVAHLLLPRPLPLRGLVHGTNHRLPSEVRVMAAARMPEGFHARKSALGKEYRYRVAQARVVAPLDAESCWRVERPLDLDAVRHALAALPGRHDFTAFALAGGSHSQPFRRIFGANLELWEGGIELRFWGEGFLRGMVRSLVGTLVEIGRGERPRDAMSTLLTGRPRSEAGPTAPAHGLSLHQVFYGPEWQPEESYDARRVAHPSR